MGRHNRRRSFNKVIANPFQSVLETLEARSALREQRPDRTPNNAKHACAVVELLESRQYLTTPSISSVTPNPVTGSNVAQNFTVNGSNFVSGAVVRITDTTNGGTFDKTPISFSSTQLIISANFTTAQANWTAQVINPGNAASGVVNFTVVGAGISLIASNLSDPRALQVVEGMVYFTDNTSTDGALKRLPVAGGGVTTLLQGLSIFDSGSYRGIGRFRINGDFIYGDYGGYDSLNLFKAPKRRRSCYDHRQYWRRRLRRHRRY